MRASFKATLPAAALLLTAACNRDPDPQPGALTADDQAQLNDAAAMLDANSVDLNAVQSNEADR